jgi:hypothetical protein
MSAAYDTIESQSTELRWFTVVTTASGSPIVGGTVNWFLKALTGGDANKWWSPLSGIWASTEAGGPMTHHSDGHWTRDPVLSGVSPFTNGVEFLEYAKESAGLHIPTARKMKAGFTPIADVSGRVDIGSISGSAAAAQSFRYQYDGTGLTGNTFPQTQAQGVNISGRLPTSLSAGGYIRADIHAISGNTDSPRLFDRAARAISVGVVTSGARTTSVPCQTLSPSAAAADQFKGLILAFDKDTSTAALRGQKTDITASSADGIFTVTALTTIPASGDTFVIE